MKNFILIGMPGAGKSTLGVLLAKAVGWDFIDTDILIQHREKLLLQEILTKDGYLVLRQREEEAILALTGAKMVISTGGSVVYSKKAMAHLKTLGTIVYLKAEITTLLTRIKNWDHRGIAAAPGTSLKDLYRERTSLYGQYAQETVLVDHEDQETLVQKILDRFF